MSEIEDLKAALERETKAFKRAVERDAKELKQTLKKSVEMDLKKLVGTELREEKRVPIPIETKKMVYERAKGRCERCGRLLKMSDSGANFHHLRKPTTRPSPKYVQFLCAFCHKQYGHEFISGRIRRKKVRKDSSSPYWKSTKKGTR
ncbi:MAG: hypothetical protein QXU67_03205 [Candidatus Bathyarchaeia archaeon]